jgi:hypothetical protein
MKIKTKERANHRQKPRLYSAETNRAMRDSIRWVVSFLERHGIKVTRIAHLTSVLLERPPEMTWAEFKDIIRSVPQPRIGSVLLTSCTTGRIFLCSNRGNQPGVFQRLA